ncbi:ABC transporter substrate-binding protein [uncultured Rothia sp.]|uniref:ABC transporter substrate-binding protein n=1 Tax=uncultured Rothia sp. TaxID=316088 RepID=UPI0032169CEC
MLNRVVARGGAFPDEYYDSQTQEQLDKIPELSDELDASGHLQISKEVVLSQQPDLVLGELDNLDRATLSDAGISLIEENTLCKTGAPEHPSFDDVYSQLSLYGTIFQKEDKAKEEIDKLKKRVNDAENKVKNKKTRTAAVLYPTVGGGTTYAYGTKSMAEPQLEAAGFKNVFDDVDQRVFEITPEELVKRNPDVLIMLHSEGDPQKVKEAVTSLPGVDSLTALKNGDTMVQLMNFTEPATPLTVDGLENIIDRFYK